ncbi:MAG: lysine--tRNA ligase [Bdellovibrionaceae bacterium]|nr:lysine--tRNA ligase [Pseudobdellovibrionaceae bacterium]
MSEVNVNDNPIKAEKRKKLHALREKGINPYPYSFDKNVHVEKLIADYSGLVAGEKKLETDFRVAGRLMTLRMMGKASFFNLQDETGSLQCYIKVEELSEPDRISFDLIDLGDIIGLKGYIFKSQKGELSLYVKSLQMLTKTLEPLPEKFHGIQDIEIKYRHRHLDLISDVESRKVFVARSKIIKAVKNFLDNRGFMEVETPVLQPLYGGASATPFTTHHKALDMKLFMKISPELYLKRLIVGGFEKVYEMGKNFRNEGIDRTHNPEFTMLEFYEAYTDYNYQMTQFEDLVSTVCKEINGSMKVTYQGKEIDFTPPWRRLKVLDGITEYAKVDPQNINQLDEYLKKNSDRPLPLDKLSKGEKQMKVFEIAAEPHIWQPTMIMDHPVEISPLTKIHRENNQLVERFEPFVANMELGNSYSELNDPEEQRARLKDQESKRGHDEEAHPMDEDFLHAIETGMPPTGGVGIGMERLVMLLTDRPSIRDIIFFPTMKIVNHK